MGTVVSICRRKHHPIVDVGGEEINVEKDFEQFGEDEEFLFIQQGGKTPRVHFDNPAFEDSSSDEETRPLKAKTTNKNRKK